MIVFDVPQDPALLKLRFSCLDLLAKASTHYQLAKKR